MSAVLGTARCKAHPAELAQETCARCGDFICLLCGPLEPHALCHRCHARTTLDWEERGDQTLLRAFVSTWSESVSRPSQVGARLLPGGHALMAYLYAAVCFAVCLVPLALSLDALLFTFLAPSMVGFPSMTVLSLAVATALSAVAVPTVLPCIWASWAAVIWVSARVLGQRPSFEVLLRISAYGASLTALPIAGLVLLPICFVQQSLMVNAYLTERLALSHVLSWSMALSAWLLIFALLFVAVWWFA